MTKQHDDEYEYEHVHEHGESYVTRPPANPVGSIIMGLAVLVMLSVLFHNIKKQHNTLPLFAAPRIPTTLLCSEIPGPNDILLQKGEIVRESGGLLLVICDESNAERRKRLGYKAQHIELFWVTPALPRA